MELKIQGRSGERREGGGAAFVLPRLEGRNGVKGVRTPDLRIANATLYQLSYDPGAMIPFSSAWEVPDAFNSSQG
jgi:hypothetical protein